MWSLDHPPSSDERDARTLAGVGLHSGMPCSATLRRRAGAVRFAANGIEASVEELRIVRTDRGVRVAGIRCGFELDLVEHFLAALGGLGIREGLAVDVRGPELPLLDGAARVWTTILAELSLPRRPPALRVARSASVEHANSRYGFEPSGEVDVRVVVEFDGIGKQEAHWDGSETAFVRDIAPARTFGFRAEWPELRARGRAAAVDPRAVMVLDRTGRVEPPGAPAGPDELARHKLLDLIGDFYIYGGPPFGRIVAFRPGHGATHAVIARALADGILERLPGR